MMYNKWTPATKLRDRRKGKIKTSVFYKGKDHEAYLSHVKVQITASRKDIYLVLVYGIMGHPMMLATNKEIKSKEDVIRVAPYIFPDGRLRNISAAKSRCSSLKTSAYGNFRQSMHLIFILPCAWLFWQWYPWIPNRMHSMQQS